MPQILIRNVSDAAIQAFRSRARQNGTSLEAEVRRLIERHAALGPIERSIVAAALRAGVKAPLPPLAETIEGERAWP